MPEAAPSDSWSKDLCLRPRTCPELAALDTSQPPMMSRMAFMGDTSTVYVASCVGPSRGFSEKDHIFLRNMRRRIIFIKVKRLQI